LFGGVKFWRQAQSGSDSKSILDEFLWLEFLANLDSLAAAPSIQEKENQCETARG
jgi:hypothetical protein